MANAELVGIHWPVGKTPTNSDYIHLVQRFFAINQKKIQLQKFGISEGIADLKKNFYPGIGQFF